MEPPSAPMFIKVDRVGTNLGTRALISVSVPLKPLARGFNSVFGILRCCGLTKISNGFRTFGFVLPIFIFAFCLDGPFLSLPVNSSANAARSAGVCSRTALSRGVATSLSGADGGAEGAGSPVGGLTLDVSSKNARLSANDAVSVGAAGGGAVNSGTPSLRRAVTSGGATAGAAVALADTSGAVALISGAALASAGAAAALA